MNPSENHMSDDLEIQVKQLRRVRDLLISCFDLLLDDISGPEWLSKLGELGNCNSTTCIWWPAGQPAAHLHETFGPKVHFSINFIERLDQLVESIAPDEPGFIDRLAENAGINIDAAAHALLTPDQLIACLDWEPARVFFIFRGPKGAPGWQPCDSERLAEALPVIRKSIAIKKQLSRYADNMELGSKVDDESSRGFITLMPNSIVIAANRPARDILCQKTLIRKIGDKVVFCDKQLQIEFEQQLAKIDEMGESEVGAYGWYRNIGELPEIGDLLLTMRAFCLENWRRESSANRKMVVITLEKMQLQAHEEEQLREFFSLTKAQARLVKQLTRSAGVEDAANALNISVNTARSHLRAIYDRMGVSNKAQLLHRVGSTIAGRARNPE